MISNWWLAPANEITGGYWGQGGCCDNDVHEVFKALEEVALTSAYVLERENGEVVGWNCKIKLNDDILEVSPSESIVCSVHVNLKHKWNLRIHFMERTVSAQFKGMRWFHKKEGPGCR